MGLTIHYKLSTERTKVEEIRSAVQEMRQLALRLPFQEVGEILEFKDDECQYEDREDEHRWMKIQAGHYITRGDRHFHVLPVHIIAFTTVPGDGSEPANIGLCRYPVSTHLEAAGRRQRLCTELHGWSWGSFCKTQYASDPKCGGTANFVRCHLAIVHLLDAIQKRQLVKVEVSDEGEYWDHRDAQKLAKTVGDWNQMVAAVVGQFKDASGDGAIDAPITEFADFEHLEAKGREKLDK